MTVQEKIDRLRALMQESGIDAYYIPTSDAHQSEYLPEYAKEREFISGFTGSAGTVVVTHNEALLWTDGRYFLQAEKELANSGIHLCKMGEKGVPTIEAFLQKTLAPQMTLGFDGRTTSVAFVHQLQELLPQVHLASDNNLIAKIWDTRPSPVLSDAFILDERYCGQSVESKLQQVRKKLLDHHCDATVIGALEDVCWLYNIRGQDIEATPVLVSYAIVTTYDAHLFIDPRQISKTVSDYLTQYGVVCHPYEDICTVVQTLRGKVYIDPHRTNMVVFSHIQGEVVEGSNLTEMLKAIKNPCEIAAIRTAMRKDGVALVHAFKEIEDSLAQGKNLDECDVSDLVRYYRSQQEGFLEPSFETIAGYGENGAIVHYSPKKSSCAMLSKKSFLLIDSGGQYLEGTTDITRTLALGPLTDAEKEDYTLVLRCHIQLALAQFKANTPGFVLDGICRMPLWQMHKDYRHGTGHGVGFVLGVHEGPQSISARYGNQTGMCAGMVTSNEPGMYVAGEYGIRIENLILTTNMEENEYGVFLGFETLTLCPIDTRPIITDMLLPCEKDWLNAYHHTVYQILAPHLDESHRQYLKKCCEAII